MGLGTSGEQEHITSHERAAARGEIEKRIKIKGSSAPAAVKTLEQVAQSVWDDPSVAKARKAGVVIEAVRIMRQTVQWDAGARIAELATQQQVLVGEILRLRELNEALQREAVGPTRALQPPPLANAAPPLAAPNPIPAKLVKRTVGRPKKAKSAVSEMSLDLAAALVPIPPPKVYARMEELHYSGEIPDAEFEDS
jgi:hypothetical protein